jgi:hypothetical protein
MPLTTFLVKKEFLLHRPVLIFQPTLNSRASDNGTRQCQNCISKLGTMHNYEVSTYISYIGVCGGVQEVDGVHAGT